MIKGRKNHPPAIKYCHRLIEYVIIMKHYKTFKLVRRGWQGKRAETRRNLLPAKAKGLFLCHEKS
jgi:hypothetical protein